MSGMSNPYGRASTIYDQFGVGQNAQGNGVALGQPDANGVTLQTLTAPNGGATLAQKQALAKALMGSVGNMSPNVGNVQPLGSLPPGLLRG